MSVARKGGNKNMINMTLTIAIVGLVAYSIHLKIVMKTIKAFLQMKGIKPTDEELKKCSGMVIKGK